MEGEWSVWPVMQEAWSCYRGEQFNGGRMVMLQRWPVKEGAWSCYRSDQFNGGRIVMLQS